MAKDPDAEAEAHVGEEEGDDERRDREDDTELSEDFVGRGHR
jgi:hypothetical protein